MSSNDDDRLRDNPLADQLADLDVEITDDAEGDKALSSPAPTPSVDRQDLSDEELFRRAVENLDDRDIPPPDDPGPPPEHRVSSPARKQKPASVESDTEQPQPDTGSSPDTPGDDGPVSDRQLFEQAVDNLDPSEIYAGKYRGGAGAALPDEPESPQHQSSSASPTESADEQSSRAQVQQLRDAALFERMVGSVQPLDDRDKYRHRRRKKPPQKRDDPPSPDEKLLTPLLPCRGEGLNYIPPHVDSQRALLTRYRKYEASHFVPKLNLRGESADEARRLLRDFISRHHQSNIRFVRIITGRGLRSETEPVIKPTVLNWFHGPGLDRIRGYVPERTKAGDYGSLIVELSS